MRRESTRNYLASQLVLCAWLSGCAVHSVNDAPVPSFDIPKSYSAGASSAATSEKWWTEFGDDNLNRLVDRALAGNFQLRASWARLKQARATLHQADSARWPQLSLDGQAARSQNRFFFTPDQPLEVTNNSFTLSLGAAYEVDLWNKLGATTSAAQLEALATRDDVEALAITTAAQLTELWFDYGLRRAEAELLRSQLAINEKFLKLMTVRFSQGLGVRAVDIHQQRQQIAGTRAQLTLVEAGERVVKNSIAALVGVPPQQAVVSADVKLPQKLPALPGLGIPADLLDRRPDVRAMRRRVVALDHRVAAAVADRLPGLRVGGSYGLNSATLADFIARPLYSLFASVTQAIFDGGRRSAEVEKRKAAVEEALAGYGGAMVQAMLEVENAFLQEKLQTKYIGDLAEQKAAADATLRESRRRYLKGSTDYLPVLTARQAVLQADLAMLRAHRQRLSYRVQLCRALGGSWTRELTVPTAKNAKQQDPQKTKAGGGEQTPQPAPATESE